LIPSCDIRDNPASLPPDNFFVVVENLLERAKQIKFEELAGVISSSCRNIAKDPDGRDQDGHIWLFQKPDDAGDNS